MKFNKEKLAEQQSIIKDWKEAGAKGTLVAVTGFGKTTVALLAIQQMNEKHPDRTTHVIVPTLSLQTQWLTEIEKWKLKNVEVFVINSYIMVARKTHFLVLDEIHRYGSDVFGKVFSVSRYHFVLGLTATIERQDGNHEYIESFAPVVRTITLKHALEKGYVSDFVVFNLGVTLSPKDEKEYKELNRRFNYYFSYFNHDFDGAMRALQDPMYRAQLASKLDEKPGDIHIKAINFVRCMKTRKQFLYECEAKLNAVKAVQEAVDRKMLVFSETTDFADRIVSIIGNKAFAYHTKISDKKLMKERLELFKTSTRYKVMSAVKAIEEGLDVEDLDCVVLVSGNSTKRQYIQRIGRSLRSYKDKIAVIINIYIHGTQDENWLRKRQSSNRINIYWVNDVAQIRGYINTVINGGVVESEHGELEHQYSEDSGNDVYTL